MTREEAVQKALEMSNTGEVSVDISEAHYKTDDGENRQYVMFSACVDGVRAVGKKSFEDAFDEICKNLMVERLLRVDRLRKELERAELAAKGRDD